MKPILFTFSRRELAKGVRKQSVKPTSTFRSKKDYSRQKFNRWMD